MAFMIPAQDAFASRNVRSLNHRARTPPGLQRFLGVSPSRFAVLVEDATTTTVQETEETAAVVGQAITTGEQPTSAAGTTSTGATTSSGGAGSSEDDKDISSTSYLCSSDFDSGIGDADVSNVADASGSPSPPLKPPFTNTLPSNYLHDQRAASWTYWYARLAENAARASMSTQNYFDELVLAEDLRRVRDAMEADEKVEEWDLFVAKVRRIRRWYLEHMAFFGQAVTAELVRCAIQDGRFDEATFERWGQPPPRERVPFSKTGRQPGQSRLFRKEVGVDGRVAHHRVGGGWP
jgi:hypothetical protein